MAHPMGESKDGDLRLDFGKIRPPDGCGDEFLPSNRVRG
jgi:hypothetical protein